MQLKTCDEDGFMVDSAFFFFTHAKKIFCVSMFSTKIVETQKQDDVFPHITFSAEYNKI